MQSMQLPSGSMRRSYRLGMYLPALKYLDLEVGIDGLSDEYYDSGGDKKLLEVCMGY